MFPFLLILWFIFSGAFTVSNLIKGVIICSLITWISYKYLGYNPKKFYSSLKKVGPFFVYLLILIKEILIANISVFKIVWRSKPTTPLLIKFRSRLKSDVVKVIVANSITLTPGTFTVDVDDDLYIVHELDKSLSIGEENCVFFKHGMKLEE